MNVDNYLRLLRGIDIQILTIVKRDDYYDILVLDTGVKLDLSRKSNWPIFVEDEALQRLNIEEVTLEGVIKYIVKNFPHLKYRPEFKFKPEETHPSVMDFVWMSDSVYNGNVDMSKRQPNLQGWLPVDEKDVAGLKLFEKDVTFLKPTIKPLTTTPLNLTVMDTVMVVGNHGKRVKPGATPLAACDVVIRVFGNDPDLNYFKASLYAIEDIENGIFGFNYHLVLTGSDSFACTTLSIMLDSSQHADGEEESIIGKFLEYATR